MVRPAHVLRVFTRGDVGGNLLGVINDSIGLSTDQMQAIAAELGFSESTFVNWRQGETPVVRIFTPKVEMEFAGHPLVGTAWVMNFLGPRPHDKLECAAGMVEVRINGDTVWIDAALGQETETAPDGRIITNAGLPPPTRSWLVRMPKEYFVAEYPNSATITGLDPDMDALETQFGTLCFARDETRAHMRFFAPAGGVAEDPATGSAAVALARAMVASGEPFGRLSIDQGAEIGAPSRIELEWTAVTASIGGTVVHDRTELVKP
jgi:trans-2,3-dihydro-3-hydroxyanthranilate isomerase